MRGNVSLTMKVAARIGRPAAVVAASVAALALASCGGGAASTSSTASTAPTSSAASTSSTTASAPVPTAAQQNAGGNGSYLARASNGVIYVQWSAGQGDVVGSLRDDLVQAAGDGQEQVTPDVQSLTGTINGNTITLSVTGFTAPMIGTFDSGELVLQYPGQEGAVLALPMKPASTSDYDHALSLLQQEVAAYNAVVQQQASQQATANQVQHDAGVVENDLSQLASDTQQANGAGPGLYRSDLAQERSDLLQTEQDAQHVLAEQGHIDSGTLCGDAGTVQGDVGTVEGDVGTIQGDQGTAQADTSSIAPDIATLRQDDATLEVDRANNKADLPPGTPSAAQISAAISAAQASLHAVNAASATAAKTANGLLAQAQSSQQQSDAACNAAGQ